MGPKTSTFLALLVAVIGSLLVAAPASAAPKGPPPEPRIVDEPLVIAHRGATG